MTNNTLIVGASGGIGSALVSQYANEGDSIIAISRRGFHADNWPEGVQSISMEEHTDSAIKAFCETLKNEGKKLNTAIITTGVLHNETLGLMPEKRLEDMSEQALSTYFAVNSIIPALWLKHLVKVMDPQHATVVCVSARVGSISDNKLGGWYGYRASKAALNQLIKTASVEYRRRLKNAVLVSYHPGTVDTTLSVPFQKNVNAKKLFTPAFTAEKLFQHSGGLDREQACHFIDWDGQVVTW